MKTLPTLVLATCLTARAASAADEPTKPAPPFVTQPQPIRPAATPAAEKAPRAPSTPALDAAEKKPVAPAATPSATAKDAAPKIQPPIVKATPAPAVPKLALISTELSGRDLQFLQSAAEVGRLQAWLGGQAKTKAQTDQVKAVGDALESTHEDESRFLTNLAQKKGIASDTGGSAPARQRQLAVELEKLNGPKFEKAVMERIVETGQELVSIYEGATQSRDADIKRFAEQMLPMAKEKVQLAARISGSAPRAQGAPAFRAQPGPSDR